MKTATHSLPMTADPLLPPLTPEQRDSLRDSIRAEGIHTPVVQDQHGLVIDGFERLIRPFDRLHDAVAVPLQLGGRLTAVVAVTHDVLQADLGHDVPLLKKLSVPHPRSTELTSLDPHERFQAVEGPNGRGAPHPFPAHILAGLAHAPGLVPSVNAPVVGQLMFALVAAQDDLQPLVRAALCGPGTHSG